MDRINLLSEMWNDATRHKKVKQCFYPGCKSNTIIKSHVFQNNGILDQLSENGHVFMPKPRTGEMLVRITEYGRKQATTFSGFCGEHDKKLFQPIEDEDWEINTQTVFLFMYRTFASQMQAKQEELRCQLILAEQLKQKSESNEWIESLKSAVKDFERDKNILGNYISAKEKTKKKNVEAPIKYISWRFNQKIDFAVSGFISPYSDFQGRAIQNPKDKIAHHLFVTIIPKGEYAIAMISWLAVDSKIFSFYTNVLRNLNEHKKKIYLTNLSVKCTDNFVMSPRMVEKLTNEQRNIIEGELLWMDVLLESEGNLSGSDLEYQGLNLFDY